MLIIILIFLFLISCSPDTTDPEEITEPPGITVITRAEKIEQLVGDFDRERQDSTNNLNGHYRPIQIPGIDQRAYEVPVEGVSVNEYMYIYHTTDWNMTTQNMERTVLARSENNGFSFQYIDDISSDHFINISLMETDFSDWQGFPFQQGHGLVLFGTGEYRKSSVYLGCQKAEDIEEPESIQYFTGVNNSNIPQWSSNESDAVPLLNQSGIGELSVFYYSEFNRWIMLYNHPHPRGINIRTALYPWGPWSDVQLIFDPWEDEGYGHFMHMSWEYAKMDSVHDPGRENEWGGEYGPYQFGNLAIDSKNTLTIYFTMSTWNPYTVVLMKAVLGKE